MLYIFTFFHFLQPGILFPELAPFRPVFFLSILLAVMGFFKTRGEGANWIMTRRTTIALIAFLAVNVVSVHYSGLSSMADMAGQWYIYIVFYFIVISNINSTDEFVKTVWALVLSGMFIVYYGIYAVVYEIPSAVGGRAGAYGMYENHNDYTYMIILIFPFVVNLMKTTGSRLLKLLLLAFALSCVAGVFLSLSRGGMIALVASLFFIFRTSKRSFIMTALVAIFAVGAIGYQWQKRDENQSGNYSYEDSKVSRLELWKAAGEIVKKHPLLGIGSKRFDEYAKEYYEISHDNKGKNAHNTYVEVLATTGIAGFTAFVFFLYHTGKTVLAREDADGGEDERLSIMAEAVALSFLGILVRSFFNSKTHDWSLYMLAAFSVAYVKLKAEERALKAVEAGGLKGAYNEA